MNYHLMNKDDIQKARQVTIHQLLGLHDTGRRQKIKCVFHKDRNPSLVIYPGDGGYCCFSCGKSGGDSIAFCKDLGLSFREAVNQLKDF